MIPLKSILRNRLTLGYLVLVGVPLLFLAATLRAGKSLTAPPAISGEWNVRAAGAGEGNAALPPGLSIEQTGADLSITLHDRGKTQLTATLDNGRMASAGGRLQAGVSGVAGGRAIDGEMLPEACPACAPIRFHATQLKTQER